MRLFWYISLIAIFCQSLMAQDAQLVTVHKAMELMGSRFDITVVASSEEIGSINIDEASAEIKRIEKLISSWDVESETSLINLNAGLKPVKVSDELFSLIERSIQISELSDGAFDISYASLDNIWKFDGSIKEMPSEIPTPQCSHLRCVPPHQRRSLCYWMLRLQDPGL